MKVIDGVLKLLEELDCFVINRMNVESPVNVFRSKRRKEHFSQALRV